MGTRTVYAFPCWSMGTRKNMLLNVKNLRTHFKVGLDKTARAVDGVSFELEQGKTLALVGESGCGKTQTAFSLIRLIAENGFHPSGEIFFDGKNLSQLDENAMRSLRGNDIAMIFQEPMTSLNPLYRIGNQLEEPLRQHRKVTRGAARKRAIELLDHVGIPDPHKRVDSFPHELSGGMKQRVMIAMALACEPKLLIADEPTTALDVTIQAQVLRLMSDLQKETGMAILLITHDMGIVNQMADHICIMYAGRIVEQGSREQVFGNMAHPYTRRLFDSIPKPEDTGYLLDTIPGMVPGATEYGEGCRFADRCPHVMEVCRETDGPVHVLAPGHSAACHLFDEGRMPITETDRKRIPAPTRQLENIPLVTIKSLRTWFPVRKGIFLRIANYVKAVDNVDLELQKGATLALVGESGCGKTTLGESILRLVREARGQVLLNGHDIMQMNSAELKKIRNRMQIVFQDPMGSLSPRMTIEDIVGEGLRVHLPDIDSINSQISIDPDDLTARSNLAVRLIVDDQIEAALEALLYVLKKDKTFSGKFRQVSYINYVKAGRCDHILFLGLGKRDDYKLTKLREALITASSHLRARKVPSFTLHLSSINACDCADFAQAAFESLAMPLYAYTKFKKGALENSG
ncbi:MAG: tetratricopeptide repeat protein, partial [Nitrospinae bacterium]|nr:tetratricopeptide repeat protein [Nitrospinota bacterium]